MFEHFSTKTTPECLHDICHGGEAYITYNNYIGIEQFQKISVLQHDPSVHLPARPGDPTPTTRNLDPLMHPFARARERNRALNAAKMDRLFAKPFVGALEGHIDAVEVLCKKPGSLSTVASGSWDGGEFRRRLADDYIP